MHKTMMGLLAAGLVTAGIWAGSSLAADQDAPAAGDGETALQTALDTPVGQLKNPFDPSNAEIVAAGRAKFRSACAPCHGGTGGGGMGPPLTNPVWNYNGADDTLFRLITLGSDCKSFAHCIEEQGFKRVPRETIAGPMPAQGQVAKGAPEGAKPSLVKPQDVWSIITWIRSVNPDSLKGATPAAAAQ